MKDATESITDSQMPEVWAEHRRGCKACKLYIEGKSATLAFVCVQGAPMVKRLLEIEARPEIAARRRAEREEWKKSEGQHKTSGAKLRREMRYKGDA